MGQRHGACLYHTLYQRAKNGERIAMENRVNQKNHGVVLLVEDDIDLNTANRRMLELKDYDVHSAHTVAEARKLLEKVEPDLILLDVMLPDCNGFDFCRSIRAKTQAHILFLTAKVDHADIVAGLACGGDDYITKPFLAEELLARVKAATRRREAIGLPIKPVTKGALSLDIIASRAYINNVDMLLTQKEFAILLLLARNEGEFISAEFIYEDVWQQPLGDNISVLHNNISRLRKKLDKENIDYIIISERGKGYRLEKLAHNTENKRE